MIAANIYYDVYLIIITILMFFYTAVYIKNLFDEDYYRSTIRFRKKEEPIIKALLLTIFMTIFIGFRPISPVFADMTGYAMAMNDGRFESMGISWTRNYLFVPMMAFLSSHGASERTPIILLAVINFGAAFLAIRKLFPDITYLAMLVFFGAFITFGSATNGLKTGCATSLFLVALAYKDNKYLFFFFLFLSLGFHHSMILPIGATIVSMYYKKTNRYINFWYICLIISVLHITFFQNLFGENLADTDAHGAEYLLINEDSYESNQIGRASFRLDFVIYSFIPILLFLNKRLHSSLYTFIINVYILSNAIWLLCMYANYTNRIASLSWCLYPFIIIFPFLSEKIIGKRTHQQLIIVAWIHLSFSLFMNFIH